MEEKEKQTLNTTRPEEQLPAGNSLNENTSAGESIAANEPGLPHFPEDDHAPKPVDSRVPIAIGTEVGSHK